MLLDTEVCGFYIKSYVVFSMVQLTPLVSQFTGEDVVNAATHRGL